MRLANYKQYYDKLEHFIHASGLKLLVTSTVDGGEYRPRSRTVVIDDSLDESEEIAIILHELGHAFVDFDPPVTSYLYAVYKRYEESKPLTPAERVEIMSTERSAWIMGEHIAKLLHIPLGKWYRSVKNSCLAGHQNAIKVLLIQPE